MTNVRVTTRLFVRESDLLVFIGSAFDRTYRFMKLVRSPFQDYGTFTLALFYDKNVSYVQFIVQDLTKALKGRIRGQM